MHNGRQAAALEGALIGRIIEILVGEPGIDPAAISERLARQDGTRVNTEVVSNYLRQAGLEGHQGSAYRQAALPVEKVRDERFSRYAAHLLQVPALGNMGFYEAVQMLNVTGAHARCGHMLRMHTALFTLSAGKTRFYRTGELMDDEFARML